MASVTFSESVGGDGSTVTDDSNETTGLDAGGHRTRFVPALAQVVAVAANTVTKATEAAASAASALGAPGTNATSSTNLTVGTGSKTLTIQTGKAYSVGQTVVIASTASPANQMIGVITAHNSGTGSLTVNVTQTGGSGTFSAWTVSMGAVVSSSLPTMTGNSGKFLTNDGTNASWASALIPANDLSDLSSASTARNNLGLGSLATASTINNANWSGTGLAVTNGGTGASDAATARTNLGAAARGANSDITSLTGLTTALSVAQGGTGSTTASAARTALGLGSIATQASSSVSITGGSITGITDLAIADGGTGAGTAAGARSNLGAAASGANSDITSLSGLTTPLSVAQGGTGAADAATARTNLGLNSLTPKAWGYVTFSGGVPTLQNSNGVSSITDAGVGLVTVTLSEAMANTNFVVLASARRPSTNDGVNANERYNFTRTTTTFQIAIWTTNDASLIDPAAFSFVVFG